MLCRIVLPLLVAWFAAASSVAPVQGAGPSSASTVDPTRVDLSQRPRYPVLQVIDGDTILIRAGGRGVLIQLLGVGAPHLEAKALLRSFLEAGEEVQLLYDPAGARDNDGHIAASVFRARDRLWLNLEMVASGLGFVRGDAGFLAPFLREAERTARASSAGLWATTDLRTTPSPSDEAVSARATTLSRRRQYLAGLAAWQAARARESAPRWQAADPSQGAPASASAGRGFSELTVRNQKQARVTVILVGQAGRMKLYVGAGQSSSTRVPDDRYKVYFRYDDEPDQLYQGDNLDMRSSSNTLVLGVANGNYSQRPVQAGPGKGSDF